MYSSYQVNARVMKVYARANEKGVDAHALLEKIARFPSVEKFQAWKNTLDSDTLYVLGRIGRKIYLDIRG